jgi:hypothetical protein
VIRRPLFALAALVMTFAAFSTTVAAVTANGAHSVQLA